MSPPGGATRRQAYGPPAPRTPGALGRNDGADPNTPEHHIGATTGVLGKSDGYDPSLQDIYVLLANAGPVTRACLTKESMPISHYPLELTSAQGTLKKSQRVVADVQKKGSELPFWFALLYQFITDQEIKDRNTFTYPAFVMHFIPIFYDMYAMAADDYVAGRKRPNTIFYSSLWQDHFAMAGNLTDPSLLLPYMTTVRNALVSAVTAHIQGDMGPALTEAYITFRNIYCNVPPFKTFYPDFFKNNKPVFEKVQLTLVNQLTNWATGFAMHGKSVDPKLAAKGAEIAGMGLDINTIYGWREKAWKQAELNIAAAK